MSKPSIAVDVNKFLKLLPQYESNKRVGALQISGIFPNPRGVELHFVNDSVIPFQMTSGWIEDQNPHVSGYLVADDDGHLSFLPADVFHACYSSASEGIGAAAPVINNASVSISNPADAPRFVWSSQAALDVVAERRRQIEVEGFDLLHDQQYVREELLDAAACFMSHFDKAPPLWPFPLSAWKPKDKRSNLVRAAALLVAEIERMDFQSDNVDAVMADIEKANFFARSDAPPPVVFDGILSTSTKVVDIWDTLKDLGRPITCQIKFREGKPSVKWMDGKTVRLLCDGRKFSTESYFGGEYILTPVDKADAEDFLSAGLLAFNRNPCIASGDVVVLTEGFAELAAPVSIRQLEPAVLPAQIVCYTVQDLDRKSSVFAKFGGNLDIAIPENLVTLYSECLAIAATENLEFLQLVYFLDVGIRALFRVKQIQDCWASSLNS